MDVERPRYMGDERHNNRKPQNITESNIDYCKKTTSKDKIESRHPKGRLSSYITRDLTTGSVSRTIWFLAWPQMVDHGFMWANRLVDVILAGTMGFQAIAGVGIAQSYTEFAQMTRRGLDISMSAMIARAVGAKDYAMANHIALQAFTLSAVFAIVMAFVGTFLSEPLLKIVGISGEALSQGTIYMRIIFIGMGTVAFTQMSGAALGASGDVITPMRATIASRIVQIIIAPFLVFGWWMFPKWGITGLAIGNVAAEFVAVFINFSALFAEQSRLHLNFRAYRFDKQLSWRLLVVAAPASVTGSLRAMASLVLTGIVAGFGGIPLAAYVIARKAEGIIHMITDGLGAASGTLVGQNLGAGQSQRAIQTVIWASCIAMVAMVLIAIVFLGVPQFVVMAFSRDSQIIVLASTWLRIIAVALIALGIGQVMNESLNRAGDTGTVMLVNLLRYWSIEVPMAFLLAYVMGLDEYGVGWANVIAVWVRIIIYTPYFIWGRWLRIKLM
jgi:putative MATE family efflux protein